MLVTQIAAPALTDTAAVDPTPHVMVRLTPRVLPDPMPEVPNVAHVMAVTHGMALSGVELDSAVVLSQVVAVPPALVVAVLPLVMAIVAITVIPPTLSVVVPAVPLVAFTPVVAVLPAAPVVVGAVVAAAPVAVVVVLPVGGRRPARRWAPPVRRLPAQRRHPTHTIHPHRAPVISSGNPQVRVVQRANEIVSDIISNIDH